MKLFHKELIVATILTTSLWIASLFTSIPIYSGEMNPTYDEVVVIAGYGYVGAVRILIYSSESYRTSIVSLYNVVLRIEENTGFNSIVERVSCELYSARVKPMFSLSSVIDEAGFSENVLYVLSRVSVLIKRLDTVRNGDAVTISLKEPYLVVITIFILRNIEIDISNYIPSAIYYGRGTPEKTYLYEYVYRAETSGFHSILLKYFINNAVTGNLHVSVGNSVYISKGSLSYNGTILSWVTTILVVVTHPSFFKQLLYRLRTLIGSLAELLRRVKPSNILLKTPSPQRGK